MKPLVLHSFHQERGARFTELAGNEVVQRYRPLEREYLVARSKTAFVDLSYRDVLRVTGEDHIAFLHGMFTQDVRSLADDASTYTALCTAKGAMVSDARIVKRPGEMWLETEPGLGIRIKEALERFVISEEVEISNVSDQWAILGLRGPRISEFLQERWGADAPRPGNVKSLTIGAEQVTLVEHSWPSWNGVDLWVRRDACSAICAALFEPGDPSGDLEPIGLEAMEIIRIECGVPRFGVDMNDGTIPLEANLESAISYTKGCYLGQEVIARATYRGHVNKKLVGVIFADGEAAQPAELRLEDRIVGRITSAGFSWTTGKGIGLASIHRAHVTPGTQLDIGPARAAATVHPLPFFTEVSARG